MSLLARWKALPLKARYYVGGLTFAFALLGDYITGRLDKEVAARKDITDTLRSDEVTK